MSLGKLPGIKGLVSSSQAKRHFKSDLSVDMISPPMGDFRHTMHVGRGGDVFGDTSFLSNYGGGGSGSREVRTPTPPGLAFSHASSNTCARTLDHLWYGHHMFRTSLSLKSGLSAATPKSLSKQPKTHRLTTIYFAR
uniref:CRIB domain-containing protein n=1 Tax=Neogobius melanostomus TaxID=47308 RepID=A0A8C6SW55_9GOBI